jgi:hypothetical protein
MESRKTPEIKMKTKKHPSDLNAVDLIKYLNGRRGWHGSQYRSLCGEWLRKAEIRKQALEELSKDIIQPNKEITGA